LRSSVSSLCLSSATRGGEGNRVARHGVPLSADEEKKTWLERQRVVVFFFFFFFFFLTARQGRPG